MKICIYAGITPSTTFINRLIEGVADKNCTVLLHGLNGEIPESWKNQPNMQVMGYRNKWDKINILIKYSLLFLFLKPSHGKKLLRQLTKHRSLSAKVNFFIKAAPIVWFKPDVFHLQWVKWIDYWSWITDFNIKLVVSLRGAQINYEPLNNPELQQMYRAELPKADAFHAVSNAIKNEVALYGADLQKIKVIYSGLRLSEFKFTPRIKRNQQTLRIISVGRAHWKKNYASAILSVKKLTEQGFPVHYTIIGGACEELHFMVNELELTDVITLLGNMPFKDVQLHLLESDLFVLPSVEEGIANVVLEAMAMGIPVITTNCGGMAEVVNEQNGWLVPVRDDQAIADAVLNYLQCSEDTLTRKITNARHTIEQQHSEQKMIDEMYSLYQGVCEA